MALTTLTLEIRTNFKDPAKQEAMKEVVKEAARTLLGTAMMLQERLEPEVNLYENTYDGSSVVNIQEQGE